MNLLNELIVELIAYREKGGSIEEYEVKATSVRSKFELIAIGRAVNDKEPKKATS